MAETKMDARCDVGRIPPLARNILFCGENKDELLSLSLSLSLRDLPAGPLQAGPSLGLREPAGRPAAAREHEVLPEDPLLPER